MAICPWAPISLSVSACDGHMKAYEYRTSYEHSCFIFLQNGWKLFEFAFVPCLKLSALTAEVTVMRGLIRMPKASRFYKNASFATIKYHLPARSMREQHITAVPMLVTARRSASPWETAILERDVCSASKSPRSRFSNQTKILHVVF